MTALCSKAKLGRRSYITGQYGKGCGSSETLWRLTVMKKDETSTMGKVIAHVGPVKREKGWDRWRTC